MTKSEVVRLLAEVPLFSGCSKRELAAIAGVFKEVNRHQDAALAREGETGVGFFLILDGKARVTVNGKSRRMLEAGDFFGEISLLDGGPRTATVTAETPVRLLGLSAWAFKRLLAENPSIGPKLLQTVAGRLRAATGDLPA